MWSEARGIGSRISSQIGSQIGSQNQLPQSVIHGDAFAASLCCCGLRRRVRWLARRAGACGCVRVRAGEFTRAWLDSQRGGCEFTTPQVPKMLGLLRKDWAPLAFHVSFKLETDEQILSFKVERFPYSPIPLFPVPARPRVFLSRVLYTDSCCF